MKDRLNQVISGIVLITILSSCSNTPYAKMFKYGNSDIYDYKIFPYRKLSPSAFPLRLVKDTLTNTSKFRDLERTTGLNRLLEANHTLSFLVVHNDTVVSEKYYANADSNFFAQYFSMSKSVMALLIGCAIDDQLIHSENDLVTKYIPEFQSRGFKNVTLLALLNMTAPVNYTENDNPFDRHAKFYYTPHLERDILKLTARENGKGKFTYRSANSAILGLVLKRVLRTETITQYLQRRIWTPLGMENPALWTIDHDSTGIERTWCCLAGTAKDFSKIALLYLHKGSVGNRQIVSESWIKKTLAPLYTHDLQCHYSFNWWLVPEHNAYMAIGKDGQFAYIAPEKQIVITRLGYHTGSLKREEWIKLFAQIADTF